MLAGSAAEFERDVPFGVWADALDAYVAAQEPDAQDGWGAELLDELAGVLPSLRKTGREPDSALADERYRAHRAVRTLLERLAEPNPLVLVLDDLHWADTASIELLAALLRRGPEAPVLVAFAFRRGQAPERLSAALAVPSLLRIGLEQLSEAQAAELLGDVDARSLADIYSHGGGNPFYLEQLARASEDGKPLAAPASNGDSETGVPAAVAAALSEELESLSPPARGLLDAAAVAGEPFEPDLAAAIAELPQAEGLDALDDLLAVDLVRPTQVPRRFVFRHPLVRRAVYESTRGGWRLAAHGRAAAALAERGAAAGERAHHVEQSAGQGDEEAIAVLIEAGAEAAGRGPAAAARWFEAALRLLPAADHERQVDLRVSLASAQRSLGNLERCRQTLLEAGDLLPGESVARRVELTTLCAAVEHWQGRHAEAHQRLVRAREELPDRGTTESAALEVELAVDGLYALDFDQTCEMGRTALETARQLDNRPLIAAASAALALGEVCDGRVEAARKHRAEALEQIDAAVERGAGAALGRALLPGLDRQLPRALRRGDRARGPRHRDRARDRGGPAADPPDAREGLPARDAGTHGRGARAEREGRGVGAHLRQPALPVLGPLRARLRPLLRGRPRRRRKACEESARVGGRMAGGTMPAGSGGPGWPLASTLFLLGDFDRGSR